jgi:hypothetical protein
VQWKCSNVRINYKLSSKTLFTGVKKTHTEDEEVDVEAWRKPTSNAIIQFSDLVNADETTMTLATMIV